MPREFAPAEVAPDFSGVGKLKNKTKFADMVRRYRATNKALKEMEDLKKEMGKDLMTMMQIAKAEKISVDGVNVQIIKSHNPSRIDPKLLLQKGVPAATIAFATVPGAEYQYVNVGRLPEEEVGLVE